MSQPTKPQSNSQTLIFIIVLGFICALLLSVVASVLQPAQEKAENLDRAKQLLIAAQILNYAGNFQVVDKEGKYKNAHWDDTKKELIPETTPLPPSPSDVFEVITIRIHTYLVNEKGDLKTFEEANINEGSYLSEHWKSGYYKQPWKLIYQILPNQSFTSNKEDPNNETQAIGYIFPINGFGLWDAIYGYLAVSTNADTVMGTTWYWQKETAGLGANIASPLWQEQFPGKLIFQEDAAGKTDFKNAPLGLSVIRGKVKDILGNSPKGKSCLDGMSGATLTGNGVTAAYQDSLAPYRPFLLKIRQIWDKKEKEEAK